ncbi:ATP-binding protein, partial [Salmonella enterica]
EAASDRIETLFEPFNGVERDAPSGASLGMAAAQRLAEAMQGRIFAARRKDAGVTFTLRLPAVIPAPVNVPSKAVILYVEADPANVALMRQVLSV